jgi:6-pyruvoyltetrahydropterin/6-carboxytetrahydropterin synthase
MKLDMHSADIMALVKQYQQEQAKPKWLIDKTFEFCYGHRVWTQTLNGAYADDLKCACRHLHGHEGKVQVFMESDKLDDTGMVTDFRHLEWLKKWINANIDHQFVIHREDPLYDYLVGNNTALVPVFVPDTVFVAGHKVDLTGMDAKLPMFELFEGMFVVDFVPTSENLSAWLGGLVQKKMDGLGVNVTRIDWWETPKSRSSWIKG